MSQPDEADFHPTIDDVDPPAIDGLEGSASAEEVTEITEAEAAAHEQS